MLRDLSRERPMSAFVLPLLLVLACGDKDPSDSGAVADSGGGDGQDSGVEDLEPVEGPLQGQWLVGFSVAPVGNLVLPFQLDIADEQVGDSRTLTRVTLRAADGDALSDVLSEVTDVSVAADGTFVLDFPVLTLPGAYSPTSGEVDVQPVLTVTNATDDGWCGELGGQIVTFEIDLAGSTFGAVPWDARGDGTIVSCDTSGPEELERLAAEDCPTLVEGENTGFAGGGGDRSFHLVVPSGYDAGTPAPLVVAFHGLGGNAAGFIGSDLLDAADAMGAILVVPQAAELGGSIVWDAVSGEASNQDVLLFDDLLTCVSRDYSVDADRVHVTGMSNGGLMTGKLLALRPTVLASAVPFSGGVLGDWPDSPAPPPTLVVWGGEDDLAVDQDFDAYAHAMLTGLDSRGAFAAACDHGLGHELQGPWWAWAFQFMGDHPRGASPEPYASGLPEGYPEWCGLPE